MPCHGTIGKRIVVGFIPFEAKLDLHICDCGASIDLA